MEKIFEAIDQHMTLTSGQLQAVGRDAAQARENTHIILSVTTALAIAMDQLIEHQLGKVGDEALRSAQKRLHEALHG